MSRKSPSALRAMLHEKVEMVRTLKKEQRTPHQPNWTWSRRYLLMELKRDLSIICAAIAARRGKQHIKRFPCMIGSTPVTDHEAMAKLVSQLEESLTDQAA